MEYKYVMIKNENDEINEELTRIENARIDTQFRMIDRLNEYCEEIVQDKCQYCKHRDKYGICTKISDIFGYELIVNGGCVFSDNFSFSEVE